MQAELMVETMLRTHEDTRNSDTVLYCKLINEFRHCSLTREQIEIMKSIPFETISRCRRKLQAEWRYKADQEVQEQREQKKAEFLAKYGSGRKYFEAIRDKIRQPQPVQNDLPF